MFHQAMSRSQRAKGSKAKRAVQVTVLLAVVIWLLYQTKHSYDRKNESAEADYSKLRKGDLSINFGRKVNAGSQNENSMDLNRGNSDETTETKENGVDGDEWNHEEMTEAEKKHQESQQNTSNGNVDDNGEVDDEGAQENLRLPSQRESDNLDHNDIKNDSGSSSEENEFPKEGTTGNGDGEFTASIEASFSEDGQNAGQGSDNGEIGVENSDQAKPLTQESSDQSVSKDHSNTNVSEDKDTTNDGETFEAQEDSQFDMENTSSGTGEDTATNARSGAEVVNENVTTLDSTDENNVATNDSQKEADSQMGNNSMDATSLEGVKGILVMPDGNGSPGSEEGESQVDPNSENQALGNNSIEAVTDDKNSGGENGNLPDFNEENSSNVMSDDSGFPKDEEVQSQTDNSSEDAKTDTSDGEQSNADISQQAATDDMVVKENDPKSSGAAVEEVQSQETSGQDSIEEKSDDVVFSPAQDNEQNNLDTQNNEEVASHEDNALKVETISNNVEDATTEPESKDQNTFDL